MKNKKVKGIFLCLLGALFITACKPPLWFIDQEDNSQYGERQQIIFTHLWQKGADYYTEINNMIKKFNESEEAKKLNVFVKGNGINFWDYWDKVNNSISGGQAPDIYIHAVSTAPTRLKYNLDLTNMYEDDVKNNRSTLDANEMFFKSQINDIAKYSDNGHMYSWPFSATVRVVYYNKDLFKKAGITELPKTWEEMEVISEKLTTYNNPNNESSGYSTVGFDPFAGEGQYIHQWGWLAGHQYWTLDSKKHPVPNFNDDTYIEKIEKLNNSFVRRDAIHEDYLEDFMAQFSLSGKNPFVSGKLGMMINNEGLRQTLNDAKVDFEYGVFELPTYEKSLTSSNWSSSYSIELYDNANRKGLDEKVVEQRNRGTWEFLKYLYDEEAQGIISNAGFMIANKKYYDKYVYYDPILTDLSKAIEHTREAEYFAACPAWTSDIQVYVNNIYSDKMSVREAMDSAQKHLESKIAQYYATNS